MSDDARTRWEYCVLVQAPSGPLHITLTVFTPEGAQVTQHRAESYDEGINHVWPKLIAELGRAGWELVAIDTGAWHFKRRLSEDDHSPADL
ncbi:MAG: hypothetical protein HZC41_03885 [Chloroflexi bacterium]|nr:hypothetical protein [Chloroflexota bacterium]